MTDPLLVAIALAGFLFSQVSGVASDLGSEDISPVAFIIKGEDQRFSLFDSNTLQGMVEKGRRELAECACDSWSLAYEGFVTIDGRRREAILLESWTRGLDTPVVVAQVWERSPDRKSFKLLGLPVRLPGKPPRAGVSVSGVPIPLDAREQKAFAAGVARQREMKQRGFLGQHTPARPSSARYFDRGQQGRAAAAPAGPG